MVAWRVLREPTVPILLAASVVHVVRRDLFDLLLFSGTALLIAVDAWRRESSGSAASRVAAADPDARPVSAWLLAAGMTFFAAAAALAAPASVGARLVLVAIGLAALVLVLVRPAGRAHARSASASGWPVWAVIGVLTCLWELTSFIAQQVWTSDQNEHPAVSDLVEPLLQHWSGRAVFLLLWAIAGCWLLRQLVGSAPDNRHARLERGLEHRSDIRPDGREAGR
jgi:uncharacterized membrane protein YqjE